MKKLALSIVALILACTCVFASSILTFGLGFGGQVIPSKNNELNKEFDKFVHDAGATLVVGYDYTRPNGLTAYDDVAITLISNSTILDEIYKGEDETYKGQLFVLTENAGLGYTYNIDKFTLFAGAGATAKIGFGKLLADVEVERPFATIGLGLRVKVAYAINNQFGVAFQLNPSWDIKASNESFLEQPDLNGKVASGFAAIAATYTF